MEKRNSRRADAGDRSRAKAALSQIMPTPRPVASRMYGVPASPTRAGREADRPQSRRVQQGLLSGASSIRFQNRQQRYSGAGVVVPVEPRDGEEMRHLPQEHDPEQHERGERDLSGGGGPPDDGRQRARHGAHQGCQRRARLERCVQQNVTAQGKRRDARRDAVGLPRPAARSRRWPAESRTRPPCRHADAHPATAVCSCGASARLCGVPRPGSGLRLRQRPGPFRSTYAR
jgi:hypothetical protein